jgi:large subunit ribosomal protein L25
MSYELEASLRKEQGTGASRRLRVEGKLPAVVYGNEQDAVAVSVDHNTVFYALKKEEFHSSIIKLNIEGKAEEVMVRDFQMHPFKQQVQHIDFQRVNRKEPIKVRVPLCYLNEETSPAVKLHGGRVSHLQKTVEIIALPEQVPTVLEVDLGGISGGQIVHLSDVKLPEGVQSVALKRGTNPAIASASGKNR